MGYRKNLNFSNKANKLYDDYESGAITPEEFVTANDALQKKRESQTEVDEALALLQKNPNWVDPSMSNIRKAWVDDPTAAFAERSIDTAFFNDMPVPYMKPRQINTEAATAPGELALMPQMEVPAEKKGPTAYLNIKENQPISDASWVMVNKKPYLMGSKAAEAATENISGVGRYQGEAAIPQLENGDKEVTTDPPPEVDSEGNLRSDFLGSKENPETLPVLEARIRPAFAENLKYWDSLKDSERDWYRG